MPTVRLNRVTGVNAPGNGQPLRVGTGLIQSITHTPEARRRENDCEEEEGSMLDWSVGRVNATRFALYSKLSNLTSKEKERERERVSRLLVSRKYLPRERLILLAVGMSGIPLGICLEIVN